MKYSDMPVCDLRHLNNVENIRQIESISDVALVIFPKDADEEIKSALMKIPMHDIASTIYLDRDDQVSIQNGCTEVVNDYFGRDKKNGTLLINGIAVIYELSEEIKGNLLVNGVVIIKKSLKLSLSFPTVNGFIKYLDFDNYKLFPESCDIDTAMLAYLDSNTLLLAGRELRIDRDVTADMLKEKNIILFAGRKIVCYEEIAPYIKATATAVKIDVLNNEA